MQKWFSSTAKSSPVAAMSPNKATITHEAANDCLPLYFSGTGRGHVSIDLSSILSACQHKSKDMHVKFVVSDRWEIFGELLEPAAPPSAAATSKFALNCRFSTSDLSDLSAGNAAVSAEPVGVKIEQPEQNSPEMDRDDELKMQEDDALCKQLLDEYKASVITERRWKIALAFCTVLAYYTFGVVYYMQMEDWSFVDALYFVTVTLTTVGYGDLLPTTDSSKLVTCGFITIGLLVMGACLTTLTDGLLDKILMVDDPDDPDEWFDSEPGSSGDCPTECVQKCTSGNPTWRTVLMLLFVFLCCVTGGTLFYSLYEDEDMQFVNALYMSVVTVSTVGYGDYSPQSEVGRIIAIVGILFSVLFLARAVGSVFDVQASWKQRQLREQQLKRRITLRDLKKFANGDGKLDKSEFILCKLKAQGCFKKADMKRCAEIFDTMDCDKSGFVDKYDIVRHLPSSLAL